MKNILLGLLLVSSSAQAWFTAKDPHAAMCSGENCIKNNGADPGYWYDVEKCDSRYSCANYCRDRGSRVVDQKCIPGGNLMCKCRDEIPAGCQNYWKNGCGGAWFGGASELCAIWVRDPDVNWVPVNAVSPIDRVDSQGVHYFKCPHGLRPVP
jgi:hypothetical protein